MSNCCGNTMAVGMSTGRNLDSLVCNSSCSSLGHADPLNKSQLGPRRNREKVREQIRDYILNMLGAPVNEIELDEQNIDFAIDQALMIVEDYAGREYFSYYVFYATPGKSIYELPPDVGYVRQVYYREDSTQNFGFQANDLNGAIPVEYFYPGGAYGSISGGLIDPIQPIWGRAGEWVLYKQYEQMYSRLSSAVGGWEFIGGQKHIKLYPIPYRSQKVIVHYLQQNKDWAKVTQAMQEGALAYAKEVLARIRGKYQNLPGPNGGIQLDWRELLQEAKEEKQKWMEDLIYKFGDILPITTG